MKKIVPFKKDIIFKTNLFEITSISLEHTLKVDKDTVVGNFVVSGEYKITDQSVDVETFSYDIPFSIAFDPKYVLDEATIEIEDFYYEIVNNQVLTINIEVSVDNIEELEERCIEEENNNEDINIFNNINIEDSYNTYKVYIIRENDNLETIIEKYHTTKEELEEYNDLSEIKIGNKIIIPLIDEGD